MRSGIIGSGKIGATVEHAASAALVQVAIPFVRYSIELAAHAKMMLEEIGRSVDSLETGTSATVRLAVDPDLEGVSGRFFDSVQ